ncbi:MAG: PIN domain-containing protein [Bacteroidales bacterium]|nr:PIN domain-containing protein [Bacteroidales bacterium]
MNKINIVSYSPKASDKFFFDNNVWMYLYCPIGNYNQFSVSKYSDFFGKIIDAGATIYVSSLILSEFFNSYSRLDFNIWRNGEDKNYKKDFRPTERFKETSEIIVNTIESRILGIAERINDEFTNIPIEEINEKCKDLDFNDGYYIELSKKYACKIVTNDRDFLNVSDEIDIFTLH